MSAKPVRLWHIYYVKNCRHTRPNPKPKYVVPVCKNIDDNDIYMGFLINSEINKFTQSRPELRNCNAFIDATHQHGLDHDSYLCCEDLYEFSQKELSNYIYPLIATAKESALKTIRICTRIDRIYQKTILVDAGETWP